MQILAYKIGCVTHTEIAVVVSAPAYIACVFCDYIARSWFGNGEGSLEAEELMVQHEVNRTPQKCRQC